MNQCAFLLVYAMVMVAAQLATSLDSNYLNFSNYLQRRTESSRITKTREALQEILLAIKFDESMQWIQFEISPAEDLQRNETLEDCQESSAKSFATPNRIMCKIHRACDYPSVRNDKKHIYRNLVSLDDGEKYCETPMIKIVKDITYILSKDEERLLEPFDEFLKFYGAKKFGRCSKKKVVLRKFETHNKFETALDRFFAALVGLEGVETTSDTMLEALKSLDMERSKLNVGPALEVAKFELGLGEGTASNSFDIFVNFLHHACYKFNKDREEEVDTVALAYTFSEFTTTFPNGVQKVLEYVRLCLRVKRMGRNDAAMESIKDHIEKLDE